MPPIVHAAPKWCVAPHGVTVENGQNTTISWDGCSSDVLVVSSIGLCEPPVR